MTLDKRVPPAAGLGGGSSDAAATLRLLSRLWHLRLARSELAGIAAQLGSDVPFFLRGGTALATGRGEKLTPLPPIRRVYFVVLVPSFGVPTREAYAEVKWRLTPTDALANMAEAPGETMGTAHPQGKTHLELLYNSFEASVFTAYPRLRQLRRKLQMAGAIGTTLSGTGSAVFGIARTKAAATHIAQCCAEPGLSVYVAQPVRTGARIWMEETRARN
jgi:4-diphosphocytidyl-2-C-methyl-D-erythritol kinase